MILNHDYISIFSVIIRFTQNKNKSNARTAITPYQLFVIVQQNINVSIEIHPIYMYIVIFVSFDIILSFKYTQKQARKNSKKTRKYWKKEKKGAKYAKKVILNRKFCI